MVTLHLAESFLPNCFRTQAYVRTAWSNPSLDVNPTLAASAFVSSLSPRRRGLRQAFSELSATANPTANALSASGSADSAVAVAGAAAAAVSCRVFM